MELTVIVENTKQNDTSLITENGLAFLIEKDGKRILYDTGMGKDSLIKNAKILGIDLSNIDMAVISHGHLDHSGGLMEFLQINDKATVYLKKEALQPHFVNLLFLKKNVSIDTGIGKEYAKRLKFLECMCEIAPGIYLLADIVKKYPIPSSNRTLYVKEAGRYSPDTFSHELFMVVKDAEGLIILCGCGHNGVKNIVSTAKEAFPDVRVNSVVGGFHYQLGNLPIAKASRDEIVETAEWLLSEGVIRVYTGHCTGDYGYDLLKTVLQDRMRRIYAGLKISIPESLTDAHLNR